MAQFPLKMNGAEVCTLEDLKKNFNPADLVSYRNRFAAWLKGWDYDEEAMEVVSLDPELTDEDWLEAICKVIGISEEELKASRKKEEDAAKQEKKKVEAAAKEEQKRKAEQKRKKKLEPTPQNIRVEICNRKSPFCDTVSTVFTCEKGVLVKTKSDHLYFSSDGEKFDTIIPNNKSDHQYADFSYLNGYLIFRDNVTFYFSKNGENWNSFDIGSVIPKDVLQQCSNMYFCNIVYDDNKKCFVIFYEFDTSFDLKRYYRGSTTKNLDGTWEDIGEFASFRIFDKKLSGFYLIRGKYFAEIVDAGKTAFIGKKVLDGVYYSDDGLKWKKAEASDQNWLDGLETEMGSRCIHIDYCNCKDGLKRYFLDEWEVSRWGKIYFSYNGSNVIRAWKEGYEKEDVSDECDFSIKTTACFNGKLLIFGENNEFAIGEIRVKGK